MPVAEDFRYFTFVGTRDPRQSAKGGRLQFTGTIAPRSQKLGPTCRNWNGADEAPFLVLKD